MAMMMLVAMMTMMIINCMIVMAGAINRTSRIKAGTTSCDRSDIGVQQFKLT